MMCSHTTISTDPTLWTFIAFILISISSSPLGIFLVLRRMTLMADGLSHGLLPGVAVAGALFGHTLWAMHTVGFCVALGLACLTSWIAQRSRLGTDAVFSGFSLWAMSAGLLIYRRCDHDMHLLTGSIHGVGSSMTGAMALVALISVMFCITQYRVLILSYFDPMFFRIQGGKPQRIEMAFLIVLTLNLMISFQILGTLLGLSFVLLPALTMRIFSNSIPKMCVGASIIGIVSSITGLLLIPGNRCGIGIVFMMGCFYACALIYERIRGV